jgi:trans-aconitate methyltransferase
VVRVDAVDPSAGMLDRGRSLPGGDAPNLAWIHGTAEAAPLRGPYALIVAGASLHWMAWDVVVPRFRDLLNPGGVLAVVDDAEEANAPGTPGSRR